MARRRVVTLFGSSRPHVNDADYETARELGRLLAAAGFAICNGGYGGTMEASARGAREAPGDPGQSGPVTIGVTCEAFASRAANAWIEREIKTRTLFERITRLLETGDAYVVLSGGTGTLLELAAAWESIHKGFLPERPILLLGRHWTGVLEAVKREPPLPGAPDPLRNVHLSETPVECVNLLVQLLARHT